MVRRWWSAGGQVRADVDNGTLKNAIRTFLGDWRQDFRDGARSAPRNDVLCASSGMFKLGMGGWHVDFNALTKLERGGISLEVEAFGRCTLQIFAMGTGVAVEGSDGDLDRRSSPCR